MKQNNKFSRIKAIDIQVGDIILIDSNICTITKIEKSHMVLYELFLYHNFVEKNTGTIYSGNRFCTRHEIFWKCNLANTIIYKLDYEKWIKYDITEESKAMFLIVDYELKDQFYSTMEEAAEELLRIHRLDWKELVEKIKHYNKVIFFMANNSPIEKFGKYIKKGQ